MKIAVTGAAGHLGGHIIESLLSRDVPAANIVAIVRNPAKAADLEKRGVTVKVARYENRAVLTSALEGVDRLVLVSGSEVGQRLSQHCNIIYAAKVAGVSYIVYTSLLNATTSELGLAPEHVATEELLGQTRIDYAVLRNGWYWENYASNVDVARATGKTFGAAGAGKVSGATRKDYAEAAAAVVTAEPQPCRVYELAGSPALTYAEIAKEIGTVIGSDVTYVNQTEEEYTATLEEAGLPAEVAKMLAGMEPIIEKGALFSESTDLQDLLGRPSTSIREALSA